MVCERELSARAQVHRRRLRAATRAARSTDDIPAAIRDEHELRGAMFFGTPLELIAELERCHHVSAAVVPVLGRFAEDEFVCALRDLYPGLDVVVGTRSRAATAT